jgi:hypothetical protein
MIMKSAAVVSRKDVPFAWQPHNVAVSESSCRVLDNCPINSAAAAEQTKGRQHELTSIGRSRNFLRPNESYV